VDRRQRVDEPGPDPLSGGRIGEALRLGLPKYVPLGALHEVEVAAEDPVVVTGAKRPRDGNVGVTERVDHAVLPEHVVGRVGRLAGGGRRTTSSRSVAP